MLGSSGYMGAAEAFVKAFINIGHSALQPMMKVSPHEAL
jgi:hypothetical protein